MTATKKLAQLGRIILSRFEYIGKNREDRDEQIALFGWVEIASLKSLLGTGPDGQSCRWIPFFCGRSYFDSTNQEGSLVAFNLPRYRQDERYSGVVREYFQIPVETLRGLQAKVMGYLRSIDDLEWPDREMPCRRTFLILRDAKGKTHLEEVETDAPTRQPRLPKIDDLTIDL